MPTNECDLRNYLKTFAPLILLQNMRVMIKLSLHFLLTNELIHSLESLLQKGVKVKAEDIALVQVFRKSYRRNSTKCYALWGPIRLYLFLHRFTRIASCRFQKHRISWCSYRARLRFTRLWVEQWTYRKTSENFKFVATLLQRFQIKFYSLQNLCRIDILKILDSKNL